MEETKEEKGEEREKEDEFKMNKSAMRGEKFVKSLSNRRVSFRLTKIYILNY